MTERVDEAVGNYVQREVRVGQVWKRRANRVGMDYVVVAVSRQSVKISGQTTGYGTSTMWISDFLRDFEFIREASND